MVKYKIVDGWPGYRVGDDGSVQTRWERRGNNYLLGASWRDRVLCLDQKRRPLVILCDGTGGRVTARVHKLVAQAFLENPHNHPLIRHLDGDPTNNRVSNLVWGTYVENYQDAVRHGRGMDGRVNGHRRPGCESPLAKLSAEQVAQIRDNPLISACEFARRFGISKTTASRVRRGESYPDQVPA